MKKIKICFEKNIEAVRELAATGFCPVECSFGGETVVDEFQLDHHGRMSHLESVAIRAYRDFFGARAEDPRFVINHIDADSIFAVASLAGVLPHPQSQYALSLPAFQQAAWLKDLLPLAETIAIMDTDPIGRDILAMPMGSLLVVWNSLFGNGANDELAAYGAVQGWKLLTAGNPANIRPFIAAAEQAEKARRDGALEDMNLRGKKVGRVLVINPSRTFGFAEWYQRNEAAGTPEQAAGWDNPITVCLVEKTSAITFGMPNGKVAEEIFGKGGLMNVFTRLNELYGFAPGAGFGGREGIGGSPRGMVMTEDDLLKAVEVINNMLQ